MFHVLFVLTIGVFLPTSFGASLPWPVNQDSSARNDQNQLIKLDTTNLDVKINDLEERIQELENRVSGANVQCIDKTTDWDIGSNRPIMFLDRQNVACPFTYFLASFRLRREGDYPTAKVRYSYQCCKFVL